MASFAGKTLLNEFPNNREAGSFADYVKTTTTGETSVREFRYDDGNLIEWFRAASVRWVIDAG